MYKISHFLILYNTQLISEILDAKMVGTDTNSISYLLIDSRQLMSPAQTLFIALKTNRNDAHQYIPELYKSGVRAFLVNHIPENFKELKDDVCFLVVDDTLIALQKLAAFHREQFKIPVIGITGSNGKTIVKEWLYQLLKQDYSICRSPKSYNSQVGVPLSVWQLNQQHTLGIFEAGISQPLEMVNLNKIIKPTIGVMTSIGSAHDEGFENSNQKIQEKFLLFNHCNLVIVNALSFDNDQKQLVSQKKWLLISKDKDAPFQIISLDLKLAQTIITAIYKKETLNITIPFTDEASINNAITCWCVLLELKIPNSEIQKRMLLLQSVAMRLELKLGSNSCVLINDFYNSDITALEIALHHQKQQQRGGKKIVILSDIEQSGKSNTELYAQVATLLSRFNIDTLIGIGKEISTNKHLFNLDSFFFQTTESFIRESQFNKSLQFHNSIILIKGARSFEFEKISKLLQQKSHDTVLEINLNCLIHNINFYRSQIGQQTKLMCMVKATGYGSGGTEIAFTLQHHHVDYLAVAYTDEGVELRKAGIKLPIMVMSPEESSYDDVIEYRLEPELYSFKVASEFLLALQNRAISEPYPIHIKLDTGMHRLGFEETDLNNLLSLLKKESSLFVKSIFSHLAASEDKNFDEFTNSQISLFDKLAKKIEEAIGYEAIKHICNSGAITRFKKAQYNMVRLGIGLYGVGFNDLEKQNLQNVSSLKTKISQLKKVYPTDTVGYSRKGVITKPTIIATIPIGYADGFNRILGNGNFSVSINNISCPTIGNICMDMSMIDVTNVVCKEGDEVIIFETNEQLMNLSKAMNTIPYEVLTGISTRVKRVYVQE